MAFRAVGPEARKLEIAKRAMRIEHRAVRLPAGFVGRKIRNLPAALADLRAALEYRNRAQLSVRRGARHQPVLGVALPIKIGGHLGQTAKTRLALRQGAFCPLALGDVPAHAAVALERAGCIEHRIPADLDMARGAVSRQARVFEIAEWPVGIELGPVRLPAGLVRRQVRHFPTRLAQRRALRQQQCRILVSAAYELRQPMSGVTLPVEIGRHLRQAAKALLARAQRALGPQPVGDVVREHHLRAPTVEYQRVGNDFDIDRHAVLPAVTPDAGVAVAVSVFLHLGDPLQQARHVLGRAHVGNHHRQKLIAAIAVVRHRGVVDREEHQGSQVPHPHRMRICLEHLAVARLARAQGLFGPFALGDVLYCAQSSRQASVRSERHFGAAVHPAARRAGQNAVLDVIRLAFERRARG